MARNARTQVDGVWNTSGYIVTRADLESLDLKSWRSVSVKGGAYSLSANIAIGGDGVEFSCPVDLWSGGEIFVGQNGKLRLADNDWIELGAGHALRSRVLLTSLVDALANSPIYLGRTDNGAPYASGPQWPHRMAIPWMGHFGSIGNLSSDGPGGGPDPNHPYCGLFGWTLLLEDFRTKETTSLKFAASLRVHNAAKLDKVVVWFRIPQFRAGGPVVAPKIRIVARAADNVATPLKSNAVDALGLQADVQGWVSIPQVGADAWSNNGDAQSFTYLCDQNQTIDTSSSTYWIEVEDEQVEASALYPLKRVRKEQVDLVAIANVGNPPAGNVSIDTVTTGVGFRVLLTQQTVQSQNGIWITANGNWTRATDDDAIEKRALGELIGVAAVGAERSGTVWERTTLPGGTTTAQFFKLATPTGNVWHSAECFFSNIVDLRYQ